MNKMASRHEGDFVIPEILKGDLRATRSLMLRRAELAQRMRKAGMAMQAIADAFGVSITTVHRMLSGLDKPLPPIPQRILQDKTLPQIPDHLRGSLAGRNHLIPQRTELMRKLFAAGVIRADIARAFGVHVSQVRKYLGALGIKYPKPSGHTEPLPFRPADYCHDPAIQVPRCRALFRKVIVNDLLEKQNKIKAARRSRTGDADEQIKRILAGLERYLRSKDGREVLTLAGHLDGGHPTEHFIRAAKDAVLSDRPVGVLNSIYDKATS